MKLNKHCRFALFSTGLVGLVLAQTPVASATEGYFQLGFGPRQSAMAGSGVADGRDAMAAALNPAGIAGMDAQFQMGAALFMPFRGYDASGTGLIAPGDVDSNSNVFVVPNIGYTRPIDEHSTLGFTIYGNGGMNTTYPNLANAAPGCMGGTGVFCGGAAGVDLMQAFISPTYAYDFGAFKIGVAPTMVVQRFKAQGLAGFDNAMLSESPGHVTNRGYSYSFGGGLRGGIEAELTPGLRLGLSGQTKMYMSKFRKYAGLFAEQGDFDIPASVTAGLAFDVTPELTMALDYQHIFYDGVAAVSNSSTVPAQLGSDNGPGFGWHDVNVIKLGAEWRPNEQWTWRAGYAYSTNPIKGADVTLNILAPGVVKHHFTGGFSYKATDHSTFEFAGVFVPQSSVSGPEVTPMGMTPGSDIKLRMYQIQLMGGWTYDF